MSDQPPAELTSPQSDADKIRLKRLAKLASTAPVPSNDGPSLPTPKAPSASPAPKQTPVIPRTPASIPPAPPSTSTKRKHPTSELRIDFARWEPELIRSVLGVTLDKAEAERYNWEVVWLKELEMELLSDDPSLTRPVSLHHDIADRLLIARLSIDPAMMSDDPEILTVIASLPHQQTVFEYLVGAWKRLNAEQSSTLKKGYVAADVDRALVICEKLRELIISYAGFTLQDPTMFPQPSGKELGPAELVAPLLSLSSFSPLLSTPSGPQSLTPSDIEPFLNDIVKRFASDGLQDILGDVVVMLAKSEMITRPEGLGGATMEWRAVMGAMEALASIKAIAAMITQLPDWNPPSATPATLETESLLGPLARLGVFGREWPSVANLYFPKPEETSLREVEASNSSLRGTLVSLQNSLFQLFNNMVRSSAQARESVLDYFASVVNLNVKRSGMHVDWSTVCSDGFILNLQAVLLRFAEPFMDAKYSKIDRIDSTYLAHSRRLSLKDVTRIKATSKDVEQWEQGIRSTEVNFITEIFFLAAAFNHLGLGRVIQSFEELVRTRGNIQKHLDELQRTTDYQGTPFQARVEAAIDATKKEIAQINRDLLAFEVQLLDPEFTFRNVGFTTFISTWLIRLVDPRKSYPSSTINLPLPQEIPPTFKMLPEYFIEDVLDYYMFLVNQNPQSLEMSGKSEMLDFVLTFLTSTSYINNPYLKSKLIAILYYGTRQYGRHRAGLLGDLINTKPIALTHLMTALMSYYVEVEVTGTHTQFYDKFHVRYQIASILKIVWENPTHRQTLKAEAEKLDKFVKFANLLMNDATFLLDESLTKLAEIFALQNEMRNQAEWQAKPANYRQERQRHLSSLEGQTTSWIQLGRSTVDLLKELSGEAKAPFSAPEIVDRLAAMLDYNLDALVGPRCQDLKVDDMDKYHFKPRILLSDIIQIYLNLSEEQNFIVAVANEGRSYRKELFEKAAGIAKRRALKTDAEIEKLALFVEKVERMRATIAAEEDLGEIPDEFLDPLMNTLMREPVTLPSSRAVVDLSTIKTHLLSDGTDPFNRVPLLIQDVIPNPELKEKINAFLAERRRRHEG